VDVSGPVSPASPPTNAVRFIDPAIVCLSLPGRYFSDPGPSHKDAAPAQETPQGDTPRSTSIGTPSGIKETVVWDAERLARLAPPHNGWKGRFPSHATQVRSRCPVIRPSCTTKPKAA